MKKIRIAAMALLLASVVCSAQTRWGVPYKVDISAYAVNDYSLLSNVENLNRSISHKNRFIEQMQEKLSAKYSSVSSTVRHNRENSAATKNNFLNDNTNMSEFVFFSGHGNKNTLSFYDGALPLNSIVNTIIILKNFGGNSRWVIFDACQTHGATGPEIFFWFNGAHSVLGYKSRSHEFIHSYNCFFTCSHYRSEDQYNKFASRFVTNGETIWSAYQNAVKEAIYQNGGYGIEPAIAYAMGNADNGQYVDFSEERLQNTYNGPFHYKAIDKDGYVKNMEIAWQDLFPIGEFAGISSNSKEIAQALELKAKLDYSTISKAGDDLSVKSFEVDGVARAWCKVIIENGKNVLFPCLSYSGDIEVSNGEVIPTVIDAPYSVDYRAKPLMLGGKP